ncbi:MAG: Uma2 family endonuclease [Pirellula sp.]
MSTAQQPEFVSMDEYLRLESASPIRHEYVDGWVRAMTGATNRHNRVKSNCFGSIWQSLRGRPCVPYDSDTKVRIRKLASTKYYYPDLLVVCDSNAPTDVFQDRPVLIVEVLSPSTRSIDLDEKLSAYLTIDSLDVYIILEQHKPLAIIMRRTPDGFLRETYEGMDARIELPMLGFRLNLSDVYEGVEFTASCVQEPDPEYEVSHT